MRGKEALYVGNILNSLPRGLVSPCLNLGSSTRRFRETVQPHIHEHLFQPLEDRAVEVIHADMKEAEGVDIVGDIYDPAVIERIRAIRPRLVLCCNMLEHVTDRLRLAASIDRLLDTGDHLLVTVPFSYPLHYDPIDTYFRPAPHELASLFPGFQIVRSDIVSDTTYLQDLRRKHDLAGLLRHFFVSALKFAAVWRGRRKWLDHSHRYLWLLRPYKVTCVLFRKV